MKISIIVLSKGNDEGILQTRNSIVSQTNQDFEFLVVECGANIFRKQFQEGYSIVLAEDISFFKACNAGIAKAKGDYFLFLKAGDILAHDRVIEELYLNGLDKDIIYTNTIIDAEEGENYIIKPKVLRAKDIIVNPFPFQSVVLKGTLFSELHPLDESLDFASIRLLVVEAIVQHHKSYKHIQLFTAKIKELAKDREETIRSLTQTMPLLADDYAQYGSYLDEDAQERMQVLRKLGRSVFYKTIWSIRVLAHKIGLYDIKAKLKRKLYYQKIAKQDAQRKKDVAQKIYTLPENMLIRNNDGADIIVSLTSYSGRVTESAPYAIYTLFTQKRLPNRIILFLDHNNWNEDNIPPLLKRLQKSGLEIMFCEDLRSYKKLIPALTLFPDNIIITVDDDVYYNELVISQLVDTYEKSDKKTVICHWAFIAEKRNGEYIPYTQWRDSKYGNNQSDYSAVGKDGILYPPHIFDKDIINTELFMKLSPMADDIWFWFQEQRNGIKVQLVENSCKEANLHIDTLEYWVQKGSSALYFKNAIEGMNDVQLKSIFEYYKS